jgi:hypothetical protein
MWFQHIHLQQQLCGQVKLRTMGTLHPVHSGAGTLHPVHSGAGTLHPVHSGAQSFLFHHVLELPFMRSFL